MQTHTFNPATKHTEKPESFLLFSLNSVVSVAKSPYPSLYPPKGTLTLFLFARTIHFMEPKNRCNAGFYRPDHDPPFDSFAASI